MVSTRHHPSEFDGTPGPTPTSSLRSPSTRSSDSFQASSPSQAVATRRNASVKAAAAASTATAAWSHTPSILTLIWLSVSLPLVIWDTGYVLGRPHTMPGGFLHWPIWSPYALYGTIDYIYGFPAWNERNGFTGAQGALNAIETAGYLVYLYIVFVYGQKASAVKGRGAPKKSTAGFLSQARTLGGKEAGVAVLIGFSMAVMTLSKTVLYSLNEYYSGFKSTGHNAWFDLVLLYIIPK